MNKHCRFVPLVVEKLQCLGTSRTLNPGTVHIPEASKGTYFHRFKLIANTRMYT